MYDFAEWARLSSICTGVRLCTMFSCGELTWVKVLASTPRSGVSCDSIEGRQTRSRGVEQEILDLLDESPAR